MQEKDIVTGEYFDDRERFADLINGITFAGEQVIRPEDVKEWDRSAFRIVKNGKKLEGNAAYRDLTRKVMSGMRVVLISLENQSDIHYAMPVRIMNTEAMAYHKQWRKKRDAHRKAKDLTGAQYLSGFSKTDKLMPTVSYILYFGSEPWDGPRSLKDMMDLEGIPKRLQEMIADYPVHLIDVRRYPDWEHFQTDLKEVFGFLHYASDMEKLQGFVDAHEDAFSNLGETAYDLITVMSRSGELKALKKNYFKKSCETEGGNVDMCQAIKDMITAGEKRGEEIGLKRGEKLGENRGEARLGQLVAELLREGRTQEAMAVAESPDVRAEYYRKYRIVNG